MIDITAHPGLPNSSTEYGHKTAQKFVNSRIPKHSVTNTWKEYGLLNPFLRLLVTIFSIINLISNFWENLLVAGPSIDKGLKLWIDWEDPLAEGVLPSGPDLKFDLIRFEFTNVDVLHISLNLYNRISLTYILVPSLIYTLSPLRFHSWYWRSCPSRLSYL